MKTLQIWQGNGFVDYTGPLGGQQQVDEWQLQHLGREYGIARLIEDGAVVAASNCGRLVSRHETTPNWWIV